ncbi:MAG: hypothetical protein F6K04_03710 [Leptolyngbya sp. SIO4C5]|uniref:hypothetical protein n=1 Tax=Sphaerothrix gracilis TaxID=3151835 RepID=UPI0013C29149|nr:hypothetical protein [Leptolyngbya sp. SIO4C5]
MLINKLSFWAVLTLAIALPAQAQNNAANPAEGNPQVTEVLPQSSILLSIESSERLMQEAEAAIAVQDYGTAISKLQEVRQLLGQLSGFYRDLSELFTGIDNRISDSHREKALATAQMRDEATFQLALVHRAQNQPELAVPLLVEIVRSQQPTRNLGQRAYQQLFELGFVDAPYPRNQASE